MNETSQVTSEGAKGSSVSERAFTRSSTVTRGSSPDLRMQLAVADVERDHPRGAALQQHVGEAAGRGADVEAVEPGDVEAERVERIRELVSGARDVRRRRLDLERRVVGELLAGLRVPGHEPGHDERLRLGARLGEPALDEQHVEPLLHAGTGTGSRPIAHTLGWAMITAKHATSIANVPSQRCVTPTTAAIGPATAAPRGISTNEPSASYELTRERDSSGTCCWKTVNQRARWIASPIPATTAIAISGGERQ